MRDPVAAEVLLLARVLTRVPADLRAIFADRLLDGVEAAGAARRTSGKFHQDHGDGSLLASCHALSPAPEPMARDPDFLAAVIVAADALLRHSGS